MYGDMAFEQGLHMVGGGGDNSYANNSRLQEKAILVAKPLIKEAIREICKTLPQNIVAADLGCSSGPNTFLVLSEIINAVDDEHRRRSSRPKPEVLFFLNDLPTNDFNHVFKLSARYGKKFKEEKRDRHVPFYVAGSPGSFYKRLFPSKSVHLFHSSYSLMWLSQVPKGLEGEKGSQLNRKGIYINGDCSSIVPHLYLEQFKMDFSEFLRCRSQELINGGSMILSFLGMRDFASMGGLMHFLGLFSEALNTMISEGLVEDDKLSGFNIPVYTPSMDEVKSTIDTEGSFHLDQAQIFESNWDPFDDSNDNFVKDRHASAENVARCIRAVMEPVFESHFGKEIMEDLFSRYAKNVARHMLAGKPKNVVFLLVLKLKDEARQIRGMV